MKFEKCTFEKIMFKFFGGHNDEKNSYLSTAYTNWLKLGSKIILQSSSKSVAQNVIFRSGHSISKKFLFCEFLTQFHSISGPLIAFKWAVAQMNNKDTLKICSKKIAVFAEYLFLVAFSRPYCQVPRT